MDAHDRELVLVGGGGHALVVAEAAVLSGWTIFGFLDDRAVAQLARGRPSAPRLGGLRDVSAAGGRTCHIALGDLALRAELIEHFRQAGAQFGAVVHPGALVSDASALEAGAFVGPCAVINPRAHIGAHAIVNTGAIVEHECRVGCNTHLAPGSILGGASAVGDESLIGLGAQVLPGIGVGSRCVVGAGALVRESVPDGATVVGVPARLIR